MLFRSAQSVLFSQVLAIYRLNTISENMAEICLFHILQLKFAFFQMLMHLANQKVGIYVVMWYGWGPTVNAEIFLTHIFVQQMCYYLFKRV